MTGSAVSSIEGRVAVEYIDPDPAVQANKYAFKCHRGTGPDGRSCVYPVNAIAFHPVHGTFATGGDDQTVNIWDGQGRKRIRQLPPYTTSVSALAFSRHGNYLAVASSYTYSGKAVAYYVSFTAIAQRPRCQRANATTRRMPSSSGPSTPTMCCPSRNAFAINEYPADVLQYIPCHCSFVVTRHCCRQICTRNVGGAVSKWTSIDDCTWNPKLPPLGDARRANGVVSSQSRATPSNNGARVRRSPALYGPGPNRPTVQLDVAVGLEVGRQPRTWLLCRYQGVHGDARYDRPPGATTMARP